MIETSTQTTWSEDQLVGHIRSLLDSFRQFESPLVLAIARGHASREQIVRLAAYFAYFTSVTPRQQGLLIARCDDSRVRRSMIDTLIDEETELRCGDKSHTELAIDFATRFSGLDRDAVAGFPLPLAIQDMNHFRLRVAGEENLGVALAVLGMGGESDFSRTCAALAAGLREHYGVRDADQQSWIVHIEGDVEHGEAAERLSRQLLLKADDQRRCLRLIAEYQDRWQSFFGLALDPGFVIERSALAEFAHLWAGP